MGNCCSTNDGPAKPPQPLEPKLFILSETLTGHSGKITCLLELENTTIVTGSNNGEIKIWNLQFMFCDKTIKTDGQILCLLEIKSNILLTGGSTNDIKVWDLVDSTNESIYIFKGHNYWVTSLVKCDENTFASSSNDGDIRIWDYSNKKCINILSNNEISILCLIKLKNGKLCSGDIANTIKFWIIKIIYVKLLMKDIQDLLNVYVN